MTNVRTGLLSIGIILLTGCGVSTSEFQAVKLRAEQAGIDADNAQMTAREAKQTAEEANSRSLRTEEMLNRGFKKSMYK